MAKPASFPKTNPNFLIRAATPQDAPAMARVWIDTRKISYRGLMPDSLLDTQRYEDSEARWRQMLWQADQPGWAFVAETAPRELVGFAIYGLARGAVDQSYLGEVYTLYVLPRYQAHGIGRALMHACAHDLEQRSLTPFFLWTFTDGPAPPFYEGLGGQVIGERVVDRGGKPLRQVCYGWEGANSLKPLS